MAAILKLDRDGDVASFSSAPVARVSCDRGAVRLYIGPYEVVIADAELDAIVAGRREVNAVCRRAGV